MCRLNPPLPRYLLAAPLLGTDVRTPPIQEVPVRLHEIPASVRLSPDEVREITAAVSAIEVHGARNPDHLQKMVGR
jgi:hypothetical protein